MSGSSAIGSAPEVSAAAAIARVRALLAEQLGLDESGITSEAHILEDLGADSLDVVELVMALEEAFDIEIPDSHADSIRTVGDVESYVEKRLAS